jgi:thioredoxin reductase (NADPH)
MKQVIIIGLGPAGISAAINLKRAGLNPVVIGKDYGALSDYPEKIENYYGFGKPILGEDLIKEGIEQAKRLDIEIIQESVISLDQHEKTFIIKTISHQFATKTVILATGKNRMTLSIPGFHKFKGKGISLCATCDGYFFRRKKIAIIGCGHYMLHELDFLSQVNSDITVFTNGEPLQHNVEYPIVTSKILNFVGEDKLAQIITEDGKLYDVQGAFIAIGAPSSIDFATKLGVVVEKNSLVVDETYQTNIPGLFAIGDVIGGKLQIAKAVYDGMMVTDYIKKYLKQ